MKYHRQCSKGHARQVWDYREERQRQEMVAEEVSLGYETEYQEYVNKHPLITFKDWLIGGSNRGGNHGSF